MEWTKQRIQGRVLYITPILAYAWPYTGAYHAAEFSIGSSAVIVLSVGRIFLLQWTLKCMLMMYFNSFRGGEASARLIASTSAQALSVRAKCTHVYDVIKSTFMPTCNINHWHILNIFLWISLYQLSWACIQVSAKVRERSVATFQSIKLLSK